MGRAAEVSSYHPPTSLVAYSLYMCTSQANVILETSGEVNAIYPYFYDTICERLHSH